MNKLAVMMRQESIHNALFRLTLHSVKPLVCVLALVIFSGVVAQEYNAPVGVNRGVIQELDLAHNQMIVSGYRYDVNIAARVEINGSYGAFTMLSKGMRIEFNYKRFSDGLRQIFEIRELAAGEVMEEA